MFVIVFACYRRYEKTVTGTAIIIGLSEIDGQCGSGIEPFNSRVYDISPPGHSSFGHTSPYFPRPDNSPVHLGHPPGC